jgi:hypothetical protein
MNASLLHHSVVAALTLIFICLEDVKKGVSAATNM